MKQLVLAVQPLVERVAAAALVRRGIRDPSAIDEAVSLVLDHLRRLPGANGAERHVARFAPRPAGRHGGPSADAGSSYIAWLARDRAIDVVRSRRRRSRLVKVFSQLDHPEAHRLHGRTAAADDSPPPASGTENFRERLLEVLPSLPSRERLVVELLLEGKSQAVIAHLLDVCEGTVSRLRARAIVDLRRRLGNPGD